MSIKALDRAVAKLTAPLRRRVQLMVGRAVLKAIDDSTKAQSVKVALLPDEVSDSVERYQEYGFGSVPFADCEAVALSVGGNRNHLIVVATNDRDRRPTDMGEGDSFLYNDNGVRVLCKNDVDEVHLGNSPTKFVALEDLVSSNLTTIKNDINLLKTQMSSWSVSAGDGGGALKTLITTWAGTPIVTTSVAASEVRAK